MPTIEQLLLQGFGRNNEALRLNVLSPGLIIALPLFNANIINYCCSIWGQCSTEPDRF